MDDQMKELLPVISELAQQYTGCDSTSITYEKAQSLMEAILFCLREYSDSCADTLVSRDISVKEQYITGRKLLSDKVEEIRKIWNEISIRFADFGVKCLCDTVQKGIPQFLKRYDIRYCPQDTILTLDYPVLTDCSDMAGADAVYAYMRAIRTEQMFLDAFDRNYIVRILEKYDSDYRDMIDNICSIVLANMIGHIAIQKPLCDEAFQDEDYLQLSEMFEGKSVSDIENVVTAFIRKIVDRFYEKDMDMLAYLCCETKNIAVRIDTANRHGQLRRIFVL